MKLCEVFFFVFFVLLVFCERVSIFVTKRDIKKDQCNDSPKFFCLDTLNTQQKKMFGELFLVGELLCHVIRLHMHRVCALDVHA